MNKKNPEEKPVVYLIKTNKKNEIRTVYCNTETKKKILSHNIVINLGEQPWDAGKTGRATQ